VRVAMVSCFLPTCGSVTSYEHKSLEMRINTVIQESANSLEYCRLNLLGVRLRIGKAQGK